MISNNEGEVKYFFYEDVRSDKRQFVSSAGRTDVRHSFQIFIYETHCVDSDATLVEERNYRTAGRVAQSKTDQRAGGWRGKQKAHRGDERIF